MSWYEKSKRSWVENVCINILKRGSIPRHIALIMDGNRRFAVKNDLKKTQSHDLGLKKTFKVLNWCLDIGITEVTMYTFSIENFKRPKEEVDYLMNLIRNNVKEFLSDKAKLNEYGMCIRCFGDITLLPVDLQKDLSELILCTYNNTKVYLNVCLAYTSREEIANAVKEIAVEVVQKKLKLCDVNESLISRALYSGKGSEPDIVIRTSGEVRLSDFLLWQSSYSLLGFFKTLWPEFNIWHLFLAVLYYQHFSNDIKNVRNNRIIHLHLKEQTDDTSFAREQIEKVDISNGENCLIEENEVLDMMDLRRKKFINNLYYERYKSLVQIKDGNTVQNVPPINLES